ncbi:MAG: hypothetical protein IT160_12805 [Bryobacterales bacterium]|nr:hypothetical protein [Bryobacterales bacterium]
MSTAAQITANRINATRSTGPRSLEGKKKASANATRHGLAGAFHLLPGEDPAQWAALLHAYREEFRPTGVHEDFLVLQLAQSRWKMDRIGRLQAEAANQALASADSAQSTDARLVTALAQPGNVFDRLQRYFVQAERSYHRAHRELTQLRRQLARDHAAAVSDELNHIMNAPLPNHPGFTTYRDVLQNEANLELLTPPQYRSHPSTPPAMEVGAG